MAKLTIFRGATYDEPLPLGMDLTGATVYFTAKPDYDSDVTDGAAVIAQDITSHTDAAAGITQLTLSSSVTDITPGEYVCDVQVKTASGVVIIYKPETLVIKPAVGLRS
jgi:hypothetical protein